ncbi:MAG: hypothetical protein A2289_10845 [Deltaproteobacteria bacterium RIFOXYA12_FULL_58_15]|nr:MAG: hypothetical protein A2289_10845 [Deltaproteobacteria bacterium RIFOXYA12_FULL_58_15]OGR09936.1 MAG: hypothetical protein A2341_27455 [Deltaproteobacteria bacterium RIFOXYB12_FULL_58_9]
MSGRDLLHKPQVPIILPDEATDNSKTDVVKKPGKVGGARDLGRVSEGSSSQAPAARAPQTKAPAFKAAYFNSDTSGVREVNQRASNMKALRGGEGASDLRKIVLPPPPRGMESPEPARLRDASSLMGLDGSVDLCLENMLGRQGQWARGEGVTAEMILQRMEQLAVMVEARKVALARMLKQQRRLPPSPTVDQAVKAGGDAVNQSEDIAADGRELMERTAGAAAGMHRRLAKMLGIKNK